MEIAELAHLDSVCVWKAPLQCQVLRQRHFQPRSQHHFQPRSQPLCLPLLQVHQPDHQVHLQQPHHQVHLQQPQDLRDVQVSRQLRNIPQIVHLIRQLRFQVLSYGRDHAILFPTITRTVWMQIFVAESAYVGTSRIPLTSGRDARTQSLLHRQLRNHRRLPNLLGQL